MVIATVQEYKVHFFLLTKTIVKQTVKAKAGYKTEGSLIAFALFKHGTG